MLNRISWKISAAIAFALLVLAIGLYLILVALQDFHAQSSDISTSQLPKLFIVTELQQETASLLALAPDVVYPRGAYHFADVREQIQDSTARMGVISAALKQQGTIPDQMEPLEARYTALAESLLELIKLRDKHLKREARANRIYRRLARMQLELLRDPPNEQWLKDALECIGRLANLRNLEHVEQIESQSALFQSELKQLTSATHLLSESQHIRADLLLDEFSDYGGGNLNLFRIRREILELDEQTASLIDRSKMAIQALLDESRAIGRQIRNRTREGEKALAEGLSKAQASLMLLALFAFVGLTLTHLVVRHSVTSRLIRLQQALQDNTQQSPPQLVPVQGSDELSDMARAANYFITEINRREQSLRETAAQAEAANQARGDFLANISHEIRSPMNAIMNLTAIVLRGELQPDQRDFLEKVERSSGYLLELINEILDFARIDSGRLELEEVSFWLDELTSALDIYKDEATQKGLIFLVDVDPKIPGTLIGDPLRIQQVLRNLVSNAIKFTKDGMIEVTLLLVEQQESRVKLQFSVRDTGIGIAADKIEQIFNPFSQADRSTTRLFGGTGLGLSITRKLVEQMGGNLQVTSLPEHGSTFRFDLSLQVGEESQAADGPMRLTEEITDEDLYPLWGRSVLLVEDNEFNQIVASQLLDRAQMTVDIANDGVEAIEMMRQEDYELVLMDIQMPRMDGYQAARAIRAMPGVNEVPIIALTANALPDVRSRCLEAGINDLIVKPIIPNNFYGRLLLWLDDGQIAPSEAPLPLEREVPTAETQKHASIKPEGNPEILRLFREIYEKSVSQISLEAFEADRESVLQLVHNLKSGSGSIGAPRLYQLAIQLEAALNRYAENDEMDWPEPLAGKTRQELQQTLDWIRVNHPAA